MIEFIDEILWADQSAPRKQHHTAHRMWLRIREQRPEVTVAEATVRRYVQFRKEDLLSPRLWGSIRHGAQPRSAGR